MVQFTSDPVEWERRLARQRARNLERKADPVYAAKIAAQHAAYKQSRRRFIDAVRTTCGCIDCGTHEGRLDFDHRPGETKLFIVGAASHAWHRLIAEIEKCDVRCASCHAKRHLPLNEFCRKGLHRLPEQVQGHRRFCRLCKNERERLRSREMRRPR